jgi:hypothetical protein
MPTFSFKMPTMAGLSTEKKVEALENTVFELIKRLAWITSNLDSKNVKRITMGETEITIGDDAIKDNMIDFGTGAGQVNLADIPVGADKDFSGYDMINAGGLGVGTATPDRTAQVVGTAMFGEDTTNFSEFESDGTLKFNGNATVWRDDNIAGVALGVGATPPDLIQLNSGTIYVRAFDGATITEQLFGAAEINHDYKEESNLQFHIHWSPTTNNAGDVKWQLTYQWIEVDGSFSGAETTISVTQAAGGTAWSANKVLFPDISGTGHAIGSQLVFRLFRDPTDAADTYGDDAAITGTFGFHYEIDTIGSRQITTK